MIPRLLEKSVLEALNHQRKILLVYGPRQAGKTTVLKRLQARVSPEKRLIYLNCDLAEDLASINTTSLTTLASLAQTADILLVDEAQRLDNPGLTLKILYDNFPDLKIIATGSSSFELKNQVSDALTGRYHDFMLYPFAWEETTSIQSTNDNPAINKEQMLSRLEPVLLYGLYPEIFLEPLPSQKQESLLRITDSYLFRDILAIQRIRRSQAIVNLARSLAYQIGSEINENELSIRLKIDRKTVVSYLDILEQSFVIIRVYPYSKNPRREIGRNYKVYFVDLGIRNALIGDFNPLAIRPDVGAMWENFIILERLKKMTNRAQSANYYFWRSYSGAEVDWLEKRTNDPLQAFEIKYQSPTLSKGAYVFSDEYQTPVQLINRDNFFRFL